MARWQLVRERGVKDVSSLGHGKNCGTLTGREKLIAGTIQRQKKSTV